MLVAIVNRIIVEVKEGGLLITRDERDVAYDLVKEALGGPN